MTVIGGNALLEDEQRQQRKIPLAQLSAEDVEFIVLSNPPELKISFVKQSNQRLIPEGPEISVNPPKVLDYVFSVEVAQVSSIEYNHELKIEYFAIGDECNGNNFILLDRQKSRFTPSEENQRSHKIQGDTVALMETVAYFGRGETRGRKYGGYLVVVTDERGRIIAHESSNKWMPGIVDQLRLLSLNSHFDKTGTRVPAPRAKTIFY